ncbi:unnamed protein product, partial [marine sediment metagenome]
MQFAIRLAVDYLQPYRIISIGKHVSINVLFIKLTIQLSQKDDR